MTDKPRWRTAWTPGNSQADTFSKNPLVRASRPGTYKGEAEYGFHDLGTRYVGRVAFSPYCAGPPNSGFWLSLLGWNLVGTSEGDLVWLGARVATFYCLAGDVPGVPMDHPGTPSPKLLGPRENVCDYLSLELGSLGFGTYAGNLLVHGAGTGSPAVAKVEMTGWQVIQFDFARAEGHESIEMNALWGLDF